MVIFKYILICIIVFSLFSCGKKGDNQQNQTQQNQNEDTAKINQERRQILENRKKMTELLTPEKTVSPDSAQYYVDRIVLVRGYVADIYKSDSVEYLNFEKKYPNNPFAGVIFKEKFGEFGDPSVFLHRVVELTGKVSLYKGKPQIIMISKLQIIIDSRVPEGNKK